MNKEIEYFLWKMAQHSEKLVFCERMEGSSQKWNYQKHSHTYLEMIYFLRGGIRIQASDKDFNPKAGAILFYPPGVVHKEWEDAKNRQEVIALGFSCPTDHVPDTAFLVSDQKGTFRFLFHRIYEFQKENRIYAKELGETYQRALFYQVLYQMKQDTVERYDTAEIVAEYIQSHYREPLQISETAQMVFVSSSQLIRLFRETFGITPGKYLEDLRMEEAETLLKTTDLRMQEIADRIGYEEALYFWRVFKKRKGISPSDYRREMQGNEGKPEFEIEESQFETGE